MDPTTPLVTIGRAALGAAGVVWNTATALGPAGSTALLVGIAIVMTVCGRIVAGIKNPILTVAFNIAASLAGLAALVIIAAIADAAAGGALIGHNPMLDGLRSTLGL